MKSLPADLVVRPAPLQLALHVGDRTLVAHIAKGNIPQPDGRGHAGLKLWKLATIRAWNPMIADAIADLLQHPAFTPRPDYFQKAA
jgi:hypothetical protein